MKKLLLAAVTQFLVMGSLCAQTDISVIRKEFVKDKPGFESAWKHVKDGDSYFSKGGTWYSKAAYEYRIAYAYNQGNAELNYKLGAALLFSDKKEEASDYLLKALQLNKDVADDVLFLAGRALQYAGKYQDAALKMKEWIDMDVKKDKEDIERANKIIEECRAAMSLPDSSRIEVINIGANINSDADEYSQILSSDGKKMYFASRRATAPDARNYYSDTKFDENIYTAELNSDKWSVAVLAGKNLKTDFCETPLQIDVTGTLLYLYAGYEGNGDILVSEFRKGEWKTPEPEKFGISTSEPETSFSIAPSGDEIAFVSKREKKGEGGKDIWIMKREGKKWSKPVNAGTAVNSEYDEEAVRYSRGGDTLWFSSSGRNSIGGFDIFYCIRMGDGNWSEAVNAGYPLNSSWDEVFYFPSPVDDKVFYFSSNRKGGFGGLDIYSGKILPPHILPSSDTVRNVQVTIPAPVIVSDTLHTSVDSVMVIDTSSVASILPLSDKRPEVYLCGLTSESRPAPGESFNNSKEFYALISSRNRYRMFK